MISPSSSSKIPGDVSWKIMLHNPNHLYRCFKIAVQTPSGIASTTFSEDFLADSPPFGIVGPGDWQSNQPIKPETPAPGPSPPPSGPRRQYTLADINIEIWNIDQKSDVLDHQTNSHPLPPFNDFPGPGGETPYGGEGPNGPIVPKGPKSGRNDFDTADVLEDIKESLHLISRELVENRIKVADILRAVDSINSRLDKHEQNQLYLEKKTVNPLHDLKLGQEIILGKLQALDGSFNDRDAYCTPEPVPQHPFRQS